MAHFHITPGVPSLSLSPSRRGQFSFTVTNNLGRAVRIQASVRPDGATEAKWLSIEGAAEQDLGPTETQTFIVQVQVPDGVPAGEQRFRLLVASVARPDDEYDASPPVAFTIPAGDRPPFPWWIAAVAGGILLIAGGGFLVFRALRAPGLEEPCKADCRNGLVCSPRDGGESICLTQEGNDCQAPQECATGVCGGRRDGGAGDVCGPACVAETDRQFCTRHGKACGSATANDNCGAKRAVASCGPCTAPGTCDAGGVCQQPPPGANCTSNAGCPSTQTCVETKPGVKACLLKGGQPCREDVMCASWCIERKRQCAPEDGACSGNGDCPSADFTCYNGFCKVQQGKRCEEHADCFTNNCQEYKCQACNARCSTSQICEGNKCVSRLIFESKLEPGKKRLLYVRDTKVLPPQPAPGGMMIAPRHP